MPSLEDQLLAIINNYHADSYYVYGNIPSKKLQNACQNYPIDPSDTPLALVDTTVMGSAKTGLIIGLKGLYFRNDWTTKTNRNFLSWADLSMSRSPIGNGAMYCVNLSPGCDLNMSGSSMKKEVLANLLNQIIALYRQASQQESLPVTEVSSSTNIPTTLAITDSTPDVSLYQSIIPELLAVCITADGVVQEDEIETACALLDNDEYINNSTEAISLLSKSIESLLSDREKSKAIFKLKAATIISKASKITNLNERERAIIVLDALQENVADGTNQDSVEIFSKIKSKLI